MNKVIFLLMALSNFYSADSIVLDKPISLYVVGKDLQSLEATDSMSDDVWPEGRVIKYSDDLKFVVKHNPHMEDGELKRNYLVIDGTLSVSKLNYPLNGIRVMDKPEKIRELMFYNSWFYFDNPMAAPILNPELYFITEYDPPNGQTDKKPAIEYIPAHQFDNDMMAVIPRLNYESKMSGYDVIQTYFRMKNGVKVDINFTKSTDIPVATFLANFYVVTMTDDREMIHWSHLLASINFFLYKQSSPQLAKLGVIYGVRVMALRPKIPRHTIGSLLINRKMIIKDIMDGSPTYELSKEGAAGLLKYDSVRLFDVDYTSVNKRTVVRISGRMMNQEKVFYGLCVSMPGDKPDQKNINWYNSQNIFTEQPVFFSCNVDKEHNTMILFQNDDDYISIEVGETKMESILTHHRSIEPYLEYISYDQFRNTLQIVSDALDIKCQERYKLHSYRLFADVFLVYNCEKREAWFDPLTLWIDPELKASFMLEDVTGVIYNAEQKHLLLDRGIMVSFKLRQLHPVFPGKIPIRMQHITYYLGVDIAIDLKSVEWDMINIFNSLQKKQFHLLPKTGVVRADDDVLFVAKKSSEMVDGVKKEVIMVEGKVMATNQCVQKDCVLDYEILYDGFRQTDSLGGKKVPYRVYWPKSYQLSLVKEMFSVTHEERYVKFTTFHNDMWELSAKLSKHCDELRRRRASDRKLSLFIRYFKSKEPITGYYECQLNYIYFYSDFKVIKLPNTHGSYTSYQPGEEFKHYGTTISENPPVLPEISRHGTLNLDGAAPKEDSQNVQNRRISEPQYGDPKIDYSEKVESTTSSTTSDDDLRQRFLRYIISGLLYDQRGNIFHSQTMYLWDVYALKLLKSEVRVGTMLGKALKIKVKKGLKVDVYAEEELSHAWIK